jgi:hypothetical protein
MVYDVMLVCMLQAHHHLAENVISSIQLNS